MPYDDLQGWHGGQSGRDVQEGGGICILMANSHHCTAVLCSVTQSRPTFCDPMCNGMFNSRIPVCCFLSLLNPVFLISFCQE